jgi:hypothetical protein
VVDTATRIWRPLSSSTACRSSVASAVAAFGGAGTVAPSLSTLGSSTLLPSFGAGARWLLLPKQGTTVRVDYGFGKQASGLYIAFNEAF